MTPTQQKLHEELNKLQAELDAVAGMECENDAEIEARSADIGRITAEIEKRDNALRVEDSAAAARAKIEARKRSVNSEGIVVQPKAAPAEAAPADPYARNMQFRGFNSVSDAVAVGELLRRTQFRDRRELVLRAAATDPIGPESPLSNTMKETGVGIGQELVAAQLHNAILNMVERESVALRAAQYFSMSSHTLYLPVLDSVDDASWIEECEIVPIVKPHLRRATLAAKTLAARAQVSLQLWEDSAVNIAGVLSYMLSESLRSALDKAFLQGNAGAGYTGLVPDVTTGGNVVQQAAASPTIKEIVSVVSKVPGDAPGERLWIVSDAFLASAREINAAGIGATLAGDSLASGTILGTPFIVSRDLPAKTRAIYMSKSAAAIGMTTAGTRMQTSFDRAIEFLSSVTVMHTRAAMVTVQPTHAAILTVA